MHACWITVSIPKLNIDLLHSPFLLHSESDDGEDVRYYSSKAELEELLHVLDPIHWERDLFQGLIESKTEILNHMEKTEELTNSTRGNQKSALQRRIGKWLVWKDYLTRVINWGYLILFEALNYCAFASGICFIWGSPVKSFCIPWDAHESLAFYQGLELSFAYGALTCSSAIPSLLANYFLCTVFLWISG